MAAVITGAGAVGTGVGDVGIGAGATGAGIAGIIGELAAAVVLGIALRSPFFIRRA